VPIPKIIMSDIFLLIGICNRHNIGMGRTIMHKSRKRLNMADKRKDKKKFPQTPRSSLLQSKSKGRHMAKKVIKTPRYHIAVTTIMMWAARRNGTVTKISQSK